jgi:hypothetical protein
MAVPKHKRFRRCSAPSTPVFLLAVRRHPTHATLASYVGGLLPSFPVVGLLRTHGCGVGLAPLYAPRLPIVYVDGSAPADTLLVSESGYFFRDYFLRSFSHLIDTHWF